MLLEPKSDYTVTCSDLSSDFPSQVITKPKDPPRLGASYAHLLPVPFPLYHSTPARARDLAFSLFHEHTRCTPTSGPSGMLSPPPRTLFPQTFLSFYSAQKTTLPKIEPYPK